MQTANDLCARLRGIDRRGYPAYKGLRGRYAFDGFELSIDHVQGDPFAAPSGLSVRVAADRAAFPSDLHDEPHRRIAFEDHLVRRFSRELARFSCKVGGSGKSGLLATSRPGPEVLARSACEAGAFGIVVRFEAGFPAHGRTVDASALEKMLFDFVPRCVRAALHYGSYNEEARAAVRAATELADDQRAARKELERRDLVAFVADGAVLPRESGVSSRPMRGARPFSSPESLRVTLDLPHRGPTTGMAVRRGVTLIVGGGYHGKSTLLKALQEGVYNHVLGDGRELVVTDDTAVKLRAEDGRSVRDVDISLFINDLPDGRDTRRFSTTDASGSTSQAAGAVEAVEAGCRAFLVDEDTSATNFMVRDELMEAVVRRQDEPITPFVERVRDLYETAGVSTVLVAGSSGAFFFTADTVVQMERYEAHDITERVRAACSEWASPLAFGTPPFKLPEARRTIGEVVPMRGGAMSAEHSEAGSGGGRDAEGDSARSGGGQGAERGEAGSDRGMSAERGPGGRDGGARGAGGRRGAHDGRRGAQGGGRGARGRGMRGGAERHGRDDRVKVKLLGRDGMRVGDGSADLRLVEQLVDAEQTAALAQMVRLAQERGLLAGGLSPQEAVARLFDTVCSEGWAALDAHGCPTCGLAMPRPQELFAAFNRWRQG